MQWSLSSHHRMAEVGRHLWRSCSPTPILCSLVKVGPGWHLLEGRGEPACTWVALWHWRGVGVLGWPWPASRHPPSHSTSSAGQGHKMRKLVTCGKDKGITYQLPSWARQRHRLCLGKINYLLPIKIGLNGEKQNKMETPLRSVRVFGVFTTGERTEHVCWGPNVEPECCWRLYG